MICRTIYGMPGKGCARLPLRLEISESTPLTNRSCSRGNPVIFSCAPRRVFSNSLYFFDAHSRSHRCERSIERQSRSSCTWFTSGTETKLRSRLPTGFGKHMNSVTPRQNRIPNQSPLRIRKLPGEREIAEAKRIPHVFAAGFKSVSSKRLAMGMEQGNESQKISGDFNGIAVGRSAQLRRSSRL